MSRPQSFLLALLLCVSCGNLFKGNASSSAALGDVDEDFLLQLGAGFDGPVDSIAIQSDSKIIVGGRFAHVNGQTQAYLARLNSNGSLDSTFAVGRSLNDSVTCIALNSRDEIFISGNFTHVTTGSETIAAPHLLKLSVDGAVDLSFLGFLGSGFDGNTHNIALDSAGAIFVGGDFSTFQGRARSKFVKVKSDGTEDLVFGSALGSGFNISVTAIAVRQDDEPCVGGAFTQFNGRSVYRLACFAADGTLKDEFNSLLGTGFNNSLRAITAGGESDNGIYAGGSFETLNLNDKKYFAYVSSDGRYERSLTYNSEIGPDSDVHELYFDQFSNLLVGGEFCHWGTLATCGLLRLNSGLLDQNFSLHLGTGFDGAVRAVREQADGRLLVGGEFSQLDSRVISTHLVRLK